MSVESLLIIIGIVLGILIIAYATVPLYAPKLAEYFQKKEKHS